MNPTGPQQLEVLLRLYNANGLVSHEYFVKRGGDLHETALKLSRSKLVRQSGCIENSETGEYISLCGQDESRVYFKLTDEGIFYVRRLLKLAEKVHY